MKPSITASLQGKRGLVVGIANDASIAAGCARAFVAAGAELKGIRAHAISPGPIRTRAAGGINSFDELVDAAAATAPEHHLVDIDEVGALAAFLVSDGVHHITGTIIPVDGGQHLVA